jgi:hypothetical protein
VNQISFLSPPNQAVGFKPILTLINQKSPATGGFLSSKDSENKIANVRQLQHYDFTAGDRKSFYR